MFRYGALIGGTTDGVGLEHRRARHPLVERPDGAPELVQPVAEVRAEGEEGAGHPGDGDA